MVLSVGAMIVGAAGCATEPPSCEELQDRWKALVEEVGDSCTEDSECSMVGHPFTGICTAGACRTSIAEPAVCGVAVSGARYEETEARELADEYHERCGEPLACGCIDATAECSDGRCVVRDSCLCPGTECP